MFNFICCIIAIAVILFAIVLLYCLFLILTSLVFDPLYVFFEDELNPILAKFKIRR